MQWMHLLDHALQSMKMESALPPKRWFPTKTLRGATAQKTTTPNKLIYLT